jgi:hypothetical protein
VLRRLAGHLRKNTVAYVALFFALAGTSFGAAQTLLPKNSVGTRQVINRSLLAKDFKRGQLPRGARGPRGAQGPQGVTGARGPAGTRGATGPPGPLNAPEAWHEVGAPGPPQFGVCFNNEPVETRYWRNYSQNYETPPNVHNSVAFYKDPFGVVHLKGLASCLNSASPDPIFVLPAGYRPAALYTVATITNDSLGRVEISPAGTVKPLIDQADWVSLDGITFRAAQ